MLHQLRNIEKPGIRMDLSPMRRLSSLLGNPWKSFPCILVAGTNGKGSTCAILSEILSVAGYKVGVYTSPHLSSYRERIIIKQPLGDTSGSVPWDLCFSYLNRIVRDEEMSFTEFELLTALAFLIFKDEKVDVAVLEVGLGGRLDATNVVEPILSLISKIDYDHREYLGESLTLIAGEKAGILRKNRPALALSQSGEALAKLKNAAADISCLIRVVRPGKISHLALEEQSFVYQDKVYHQSLIGSHQAANACLAIEGARELSKLGFTLTEENIDEGVKRAKWPARLECVYRSPEILVDAAHNPGGGKALFETLKKLKLKKPHFLILGILEDKDAAGLLQALAPWGEEWIFTRSASPRAALPEKLLSIAQALGIQKKFHLTGRVGEACRQVLSTLKNEGTAVITGSLTTAGEARRILTAIRRQPAAVNGSGRS